MQVKPSWLLGSAVFKLLRERSAEADQEDVQPAPIPASPQPATMAPSLLLVGPVAGHEEGPVEGQEEGTTMVTEDNEDLMPIFKRRVFIDSTNYHKYIYLDPFAFH